MTPWLRSRRFHAGLLAGLAVPLFLLVLLAAQANGQRDATPTANDREQRVIVRNYGGCCPDAQDAARLREMIESMPRDVVLIENFTGCCCKDGETTRTTRGQAERAPMRGAGAVPPRTWRDPQAAAAAEPVPTQGVPTEGVAADRMDFPVMPPAEAGLPFLSQAPGVQPRGLFGLLAVPLLFLVGSTSGRPDPPGLICPDSGVPTGPDRPRC